MSRTWPSYKPVITYTISTAYSAIGLGLMAQPSRFARTPSYANLLQFAPARAWGAAYLLIAVLLVAWRLTHRVPSVSRRLGVAAHTLATSITLWWLAAFVVRYATDDATTIVNLVSWSVFLSLVIRSSGGLDAEDREDVPSE